MNPCQHLFRFKWINKAHAFCFKVDIVKTDAVLRLCLQENPAAILGELRAIKAKHANLFLEMEEIAAAQKQSMNSLRSSMNAVTELTRHLQHTRDLQVPSPTGYTL